MNEKENKLRFNHPLMGNVLLSIGDYVKTKWNWWGEIIEISEIKHGQGLMVRRLKDDISFSISDYDVLEFNIIKP